MLCNEGGKADMTGNRKVNDVSLSLAMFSYQFKKGDELSFLGKSHCDLNR